eukprot:2094642-Amphidinium_carterae.1
MHVDLQYLHGDLVWDPPRATDRTALLRADSWHSLQTSSPKQMLRCQSVNLKSGEQSSALSVSKSAVVL